MEAAALKAQRDHDLFMHNLRSPKHDATPQKKGSSTNLKQRSRPITAKVRKSRMNK